MKGDVTEFRCVHVLRTQSRAWSARNQFEGGAPACHERRLRLLRVRIVWRGRGDFPHFLRAVNLGEG